MNIGMNTARLRSDLIIVANGKRLNDSFYLRVKRTKQNDRTRQKTTEIRD